MTDTNRMQITQSVDVLLRDRIVEVVARELVRQAQACGEYQTRNCYKVADAVIAALGGMDVLQYLEVPQRVMLNKTRPNNILALRAQALDRVQELIWPEDQDWPADGPPNPSREQWDRIVEAAFPPPPLAGAE